MLFSVRTIAQDQVCGDFGALQPAGTTTATSGKVVIADRFGNRYSPEDISVISLAAYNKLPNGNIADCTAGLFDVYFDDLRAGSPAIGFADPSLGVTRRNLFCQVLTDLSVLLNHPPNDGRVNIRVLSSLDLPGSPLAMASSYYVFPTPLMNGIVDGEVFKTIVSGQSSYNLNGQPSPMLGAGVEYYHGAIRFNFMANANYHYSLTQPLPANGRDFYQIVLHEMLHCLGMASLIDQNGGSRLSADGNPNWRVYTRFDTYLQSGGQSLITVAPNASVAFNTTVSTTPASQCGVFDGSGNFNGSQDLYAPSPWEPAASLSHFGCGWNSLSPCPTNLPHVLQSCVPAGGTPRRRPSHAEYETLCNIGYTLNATYGNATTAVGGSTFFLLSPFPA